MRSTDDKCMMIRRILAQKGLQGEPTIAKCKQLRLDLQAKRESAELDKSLIIRTEGTFITNGNRIFESNSNFNQQVEHDVQQGMSLQNRRFHLNHQPAAQTCNQKLFKRYQKFAEL